MKQTIYASIALAFVLRLVPVRARNFLPVSEFGNEDDGHHPMTPMTRDCRTMDGQVGTCGPLRSCSLVRPGNLIHGARPFCQYVDVDAGLIQGVCCPKVMANASGGAIAMVVPVVPINPISGLPEPHFSWWNLFPFLPTTTVRPNTTHLPITGAPLTTSVSSTFNRPPITSTTTTTTKKPTMRPTLSPSEECGVGPWELTDYHEDERIVGGSDAVPHSWPSLVGIFHKGRLFCGGSLIDSTHVLTAAHCVAMYGVMDIPHLEVVMGMHKVKPLDPNVIKRRLLRIARHQDYDAISMENDIAIITLESAVRFDDKVSPICLPATLPGSNADSFAQDRAAIIGWGTVSHKGQSANVLQQAVVEIMTNRRCKSKFAFNTITNDMLCAYAEGIDTCQGDSGGPLLVQTEGGRRWIQVGIVSWGYGCAGSHPGVYTRITHFSDWIQDNLKY